MSAWRLAIEGIGHFTISRTPCLEGLHQRMEVTASKALEPVCQNAEADSHLTLQALERPSSKDCTVMFQLRSIGVRELSLLTGLILPDC